MKRFPFDAATVTNLGGWVGNMGAVGSAGGVAVYNSAVDEGEGSVVFAKASVGVAGLAANVQPLRINPMRRNEKSFTGMCSRYAAGRRR